MNPFDRALTTLPLAASFVALLAATSPALSHEFRVGDLELEHPNAPPTPPGVSSAAGYLVITNEGSEDDRLIGGSAPFASGIEIHRTIVEDDVSRMRRLEDGLLVPAGSTVRLDPGETHLMFTGLASPLADGERRPATLEFERAGSVDVEFAIEPFAAGEGADGSMDHGEMDHGEMDHGEMDHGEMDHGEMDHDTIEGGVETPE